jgi:uncharacterized membrane protein
MLALVLALGASVAWGSADFIAGVGCRRVALLTVLLVSQAAGLILLVPVLAAASEAPPPLSSMALAALAGLFNALALAALYRGLARGKMGLVAPIAATDAAIPVAFGLLGGDRPATIAIMGIGLALAGVVLASRGGRRWKARRRRRTIHPPRAWHSGSPPQSASAASWSPSAAPVRRARCGRWW